MISKSVTATDVIATLRAHEAELRQAGIRHLSLFGSVARGEAATGSDIDLAAEFAPEAGMDLVRRVGPERRGPARFSGHRVENSGRTG